MSGLVRVQVLMPPAEAERFEGFCRRNGHKKSTLIARLVRDYLDDQDRQSPAMHQAARR